jgi:hypothetical protein
MVKTLQYVEPGGIATGQSRVIEEFLSGMVRKAA